MQEEIIQHSSLSVPLPSFSPGKKNVEDIKKKKFSEDDYSKCYLDEIDLFCEHLLASYYVLGKKKSQHFDYPNFLVNLFDYLYPSPSIYEYIIKDCYINCVIPYIREFLIFPQKEEIIQELNQIAQKLTKPTINYKDDFTEISDQYLQLTLQLILNQKDKVNASLQINVEIENERFFTDDVKKHDPTSFLQAYVSFFYDGYKMLWSTECNSISFEDFINPILEKKQNETIKAVKFYLERNKLKPIEIISILDALYRQGIKKSIPPQYLNIFWYVLQGIKKTFPPNRYEYPVTAIREFKPFFTKQFLRNAITKQLKDETKVQELFLSEISEEDLENLIYANYKAVPKIKVGCDSGPFYYFLYLCMKFGASFTPTSLQKGCDISLSGKEKFWARNYSRWLNYKIDSKSGLLNPTENELLYNDVMSLFT
jgi:hypothetical protein